MTQPPQKTAKPQGKFWIIIGIALIFVGVALGALTFFGILFTNVFDQKTLENGIRTTLGDKFGETDVPVVSCPPDQPVKSGTTFTCKVQIGQSTKAVTVEVLDYLGKYQVDAPH